MNNIKQRYVKIEYTKEGPTLRFFMLSQSELSKINRSNRLNYLTDEQAEGLMHNIFEHITLVRKNNKLFETEYDLTLLKITIANVFGLSNYELLSSKSRKSELVTARYTLFTMLCVDGYSTQERIGQTCNRDHATVIHALKHIQNLIQTKDPLYYNRIRLILEKYRMYQKTLLYLEKHVK